jgi:hypothetical protein
VRAIFCGVLHKPWERAVPGDAGAINGSVEPADGGVASGAVEGAEVSGGDRDITSAWVPPPVPQPSVTFRGSRSPSASIASTDDGNRS